MTYKVVYMPTESEIKNYKQFENMQFLKPHELGG